LLLLPFAAFLVHQLRYELTYGSAAGRELTAQGHSYLHSVVPWLVLLLGLSAGFFLCEVARARRDEGLGEPGFVVSSRVLWVCSALLLVITYATQEFLESLFADGHPAGFTGIFGHGGWWSIPAAALVAALIVALQRLARAVRAALCRRAPLRLRTRPQAERSPLSAARQRRSPLALAAAGRAPPHAFVGLS
jgi:hypothetical protein